MQFVTMLLVAVGILTFLTGLSVFAGAAKGNRGASAWFFIMTIGTTIWELAIGLFLSLPTANAAAAPGIIWALYMGAPVMLAGFVGYTGWRYGLGKFLTILYMIMAAGLSVVLAQNSGLLYSEIALTNTGNSVQLILGNYYWAYMAFCVVTAVSMLGFALYGMVKARTRNEKKGLMVLMLGTSMAAVFISIFDLFLPLMRYDLIWVGPLAASINIIGFYYATIRYRLMPLNTNWLRVLSYVVIVVSAAIIYMVVFFLLFGAIFRAASPSVPIIILNFVMVLVVLLLMPALNEVTAFIRSLISVRQIDVGYMVKRLNRMAGATVKYNELAGFLADHLHFQYVGVIVNNHIYSSHNIQVSSDQLADITSLKNPDYGVWQKIDKDAVKVFEELDLVAAAQLRDGKGKPYGQVVLGRPVGGVSFERRDLVQIELIMELVGNVAAGKAKKGR